MKRFPPPWIADTLFPATVVGYFAWWTHLHFLSDLWHGVWGYSYYAPLPYYSGEWASSSYSLPDQFLFITFAAGAMAIGALLWTMPRSLPGKMMTLLALLCVFGSALYSTTSHRRQELFADGTRQLILRLESKERLDSYDEHILEAAKATYDEYVRRKGQIQE